MVMVVVALPKTLHTVVLVALTETLHTVVVLVVVADMVGDLLQGVYAFYVEA